MEERGAQVPLSVSGQPPLLADKLRLPRFDDGTTTRRRLLDLLDTAMTRPLTTVIAPAGYGKTSLLAEWAARSPRRVAWVSLDEGDNDLARFWAYVIEALRPFRGDLGEQGWSWHWTPERALDETFSIALLNEIGTGEDELVLVLDNVHVIESESVQRVVNFWIRHMPPPLRLVLAARSAAHLPLARVRAAGRLAEIGARDLALTDQEACELVRAQGVTGVGQAEIGALQAKLEGWAAGLKLAALSLEGRADARRFIAELSGSHQLIADYLTEVVLEGQPPEVREFMLKTSVARRLAAPLCQAIMQEGQSETWQAMLERLERHNLFVVALDDERHWYRYHRAFRDHLRSLLVRTRPHLLREACTRACGWLEENGWQAEAIRVALVAGDVAHVTRLVEANRELMMERGEMATLRSSIEALPPEVVRARPALSLARAWALAPSVSSEESLEDAERALAGGDPSFGALSCEIAAVRAMLASLRYQPLPLEVECRQAAAVAVGTTRGEAAEENGPALAGGPALCAYCTLRRGLARMLAGDFEGARGALAEVASPSVAGEHRLLGCLAYYYLAFVTAKEGRFRDADAILRTALRVARSPSGEELPIAALAHMGLGRLAYEWDDLDAAQEELEIGLRLSDGWWVRRAVAEAQIILARVLLARGEHERALQTFLGRQIPVRPSPMVAHVPTSMVRLWLRTHRDEVPGLIDAVRRAVTCECAREGEFSLEMCHLASFAVQVLIVQSRLDEASRLLELIGNVATRRGVRRELLEVALLRTLLAVARKNAGRAMIALAQALTLAEPEGFVRLFVDEGEPMLKLLEEAARRGIAPGYVERLLVALARSRAAAAGREPAAPGPLTEREREVLRLVADGLTSRQVAEQLVISLSTVKQHLQNIYAELDVHSRLQAVQRARELALL